MQLIDFRFARIEQKVEDRHVEFRARNSNKQVAAVPLEADFALIVLHDARGAFPLVCTKETVDGNCLRMRFHDPRREVSFLGSGGAHSRAER